MFKTTEGEVRDPFLPRVDSQYPHRLEFRGSWPVHSNRRHLISVHMCRTLSSCDVPDVLVCPRRNSFCHSFVPDPFRSRHHCSPTVPGWRTFTTLTEQTYWSDRSLTSEIKSLSVRDTTRGTVSSYTSTPESCLFPGLERQSGGSKRIRRVKRDPQFRVYCSPELKSRTRGRMVYTCV